MVGALLVLPHASAFTTLTSLAHLRPVARAVKCLWRRVLAKQLHHIHAQQSHRGAEEGAKRDSLVGSFARALDNRAPKTPPPKNTGASSAASPAPARVSSPKAIIETNATRLCC